MRRPNTLAGLAAATAASLLAACAAPLPPPAVPPSGGAWYGHDHGPRPHPYPPRYTYVSPDPSDPCGARELQWLVGRDRGAVPPQRPDQARRVYSTDMGVTADFSASRLNILYDVRSGRVLRVSCG